MDYPREYTPAAYGADYVHNLRWRYRRTYGRGNATEPYRSGGSFGRGYQRADDIGMRSPDAGPRPDRGYAESYYRRHPGGYRGRRRRSGTAARARGYPYFGSAAAVEAAQGYPPADTLHAEVYPSALGWGVGDYGEEYEPPGEVANRWRRSRARREGRERERAGRRRRARRR